MVAKSPLTEREKRLAAALDPNLIRETVKKVDKCVARLQELQYTVSGGKKVVGGSSLSPRSTRGYLRTSLRCKQETLRLKNTSAQKSPPGKFPTNNTGEWRRMSLPAMLLGETLAEIQQATQFAKQAAAGAGAGAGPNSNIICNDPKTPVTRRTRSATTTTNNKNKNDETTTPLLRSRRMREKQTLRRTIRTESSCCSPTRPNPRARARITFKPVSPSSARRDAVYRHVAAAHRASPKNKPWTKKKTAVLFPNPTFNPSSTSPLRRMMPSRPKSPVMIPGIKRSPPHRFLVKSPTGSSKVQVRIKTPPPTISPTRQPESRMSPAKLLRRSFSPSRLANRLVSPLKSRISAYRRSCGSGAALLAGTSKTRPEFSTPVRQLQGRGK